jgi:hypothetical protein
MSGGQRHPTYTRSALRRVVYGLIGIALVMTVGVIGFREIEGMSLVNAVYFESMLATGQGPPLALNTDLGKIFASIMAFLSLGSVLTTLFVTLVPLGGEIWREFIERSEEGAVRIERDISRNNDEEPKS